MATATSALPDDIDALKALVSSMRVELTAAQARASAADALVAHLKQQIALLRRDKYGASAERSQRLADQLELHLEELEADAGEDEVVAELATPATDRVASFERKALLSEVEGRPARKPFPAHLPRERIVVPTPCACPSCGGERLSKLGEDVTETLEVVPRRWKVVQTVRERFSCRDCEKISQPPAPFHVVPRGWAGSSFLAMLLFDKYGQHLPLNRQAERFAAEGVPLSLSTLADQVGAATAALMPLFRLVEAHVMAAARLHGDDTTVPVLARGGACQGSGDAQHRWKAGVGKTNIGRLWVYVRDDRPFAGADPPAAVFHYSGDRRGEHPRAHLDGWTGILQADAYAGYDQLYAPGRLPVPLIEASCFAHARRGFFELADVEGSARRRAKGRESPVYPVAVEAVRRIDALFDIERACNGLDAEARLAVRREHSASVVADLHAWLTEQRSLLSRHHGLAKAIHYMLRRWASFTRFLDDGRVCLTNNAAERALRCVALGRKSWLFCGSDRGGQRAAVMYSLIGTAKLNSVDPQAWLADILARIAGHPASRLHELLPWNWQHQQEHLLAA